MRKFDKSNILYNILLHIIIRFYVSKTEFCLLMSYYKHVFSLSTVYGHLRHIQLCLRGYFDMFLCVFVHSCARSTEENSVKYRVIQYERQISVCTLFWICVQHRKQCMGLLALEWFKI